MNDDQLVQLLREVRLPEEPVDRYDGVVRRRRAAQRRRVAVSAVGLSLVALSGGVVVVASRSRPVQHPNIATLLSAPAGTAHVKGIGGDGPEGAVIEGDIDFARKRAHVVTTLGGQRFELISIGKDLWTKVPEPAGHALTRPSWVHEPNSDFRSRSAALDPAGLLEGLRSSDASLAREGVESIDGVSTTHFAVTLPQGRQSDPFPAGHGDIWVDGDGLVRRLSYPAYKKDNTVEVAARLEFSDFGEAVDIEPPPADQVTEQQAVSGSPGSSSPALPKALCAQLKAQIDADPGIPAGQKAQLEGTLCTGGSSTLIEVPRAGK